MLGLGMVRTSMTGSSIRPENVAQSPSLHGRLITDCGPPERRMLAKSGQLPN